MALHLRWLLSPFYASDVLHRNDSWPESTSNTEALGGTGLAFSTESVGCFQRGFMQANGGESQGVSGIYKHHSQSIPESQHDLDLLQRNPGRNSPKYKSPYICNTRYRDPNCLLRLGEERKHVPYVGARRIQSYRT